MDLLKLKKVLLIAFYVGVIAIGIAGFLTLRSMRQVIPPIEEPQELVTPRADSTAGLTE